MHVYKSLTAPSIVTHSVTCNFNGKENLVVVKGASLLQVFKTVRVQQHVFDDSSNNNEGGDKENGQTNGVIEGDDTFLDTGMTLEAAREEHTTKLVLESEWPLDGQVTGLSSIKTIASSKTDSLLISFRFAKMVLLSWDFVAHSISTVSLHYYEKELEGSPYLDKTFTSMLRVDPHGACASLAIQQDSIAFLPFVQRDVLDEAPAAVNGQQQPQLPQLHLPSFILSASTLNETVSNIIDFTFLHEYREPTIAIIYEPTRTWAGLLPVHKDTVKYLVLSLDLQQRSSTAIVSSQGLPYDIRKLVPVRHPIGGCLLVGSNELIHIDSQGRKHGVSVKKFSEVVTDDKLADQTSLDLDLDGCTVTNIPGVEDEMLLILQNGDLWSIKFEIESRRVQGFRFVPIDSSIKITNPLTVSIMAPRHIFVGSATSDATLLQWKRLGEKSENAKSVVALEKTTVEDDHDELDDIYGDDDGGANDVSINAALSNKPIVYSASDRLKAYGPIQDMVIGRSANKLNVVAATGYSTDMSISIFNQHIFLENLSDLQLQYQYTKIWTLNPSGMSTSEEDTAFDSFMIATNDSFSSLYRIEQEFSDVTSETKDFISKEPTIGAQTLLQGQVVVQVTAGAVTLFDSNFSKLSAKKLKSVPTEASFTDDFVSLVFKEEPIQTYQVSREGDKWSISVRHLTKATPGPTYISSALSQTLVQLFTSNEKKRTKRKRDDDMVEVENAAASRVPVGFTITRSETGEDQCAMYFLHAPSFVLDLSCIFRLPPSAYLDGTKFVSSETIEDETTVSITAIQHFSLINDSEQEEYIAIKTAASHIYFYHIYKEDSNYYLLKVQHSTALASLLSPNGENTEEDQVPIELIPFRDIDGYSGLFITGACPFMVIKESHSPLQVQKVASDHPIIGFSTFNTTSVYQGFAYMDSQNRFQIAKLPSDTDFGTSWPARRVNVGSPLTSLCYHEFRDVYVAATTDSVPYVAVDEDGLPIPGALDEMPKATNYQSKVKLISPKNWSVIDEIELQENETVMTLKSVTLRVSEKSSRKKNFIVFGTSIMRGEDLAAKGGFYIYEAIEVVPEPGRPESNLKLKLVVSEVAKGAVTALCEINGDLLIAQAQKVMFFLSLLCIFLLTLNRLLFETFRKTIQFRPLHF